VTLSDAGSEHVLATRLVGLHWETAVALAFTAATRLGADPSRAARAIASLPTSRERLSMTTASGGARFLVDTAKGRESSLEAAFAALAALPARRKLAVIGSLIDFPEGAAGETVARVTQRALTVAGGVMLYGSAARDALPETLADPRVRRYDAIRMLGERVLGRHRARRPRAREGGRRG